MRTGLWAIILFGLVVSAACRSDDDLYQPPAQFELELHESVLDNGLKVIIVPNRTMPIVFIQVGIHAGSIVETPDTNGFAHFVEHMVAKRGLSVSDPDELMYQLRQRGVLYNASTSQDMVLYYYEVFRDQASEVLKLVAQSVTQPVFAEQQVDDERGAVLSEMDLYDADPEYDVFYERDKLLYSSSHERRNVLGNREVVLHATASELQSFHSTWYVPSNAVVILTGDVDPVNGRNMVKEHFAHWPKAENPFKSYQIPEYPPLKDNQSKVLHGDVSDTTIIMAWQGPDTRRHRHDTIVGDLLINLTYQPFNDFRHLVNEEMATGASFDCFTKRHSGTVQIKLSLPAGNERKTLAELKQMLQSMPGADWITEDELAMAKDELWFNWVAGLNEATQAGHDVGFWWGVADIDYFADYLDEMSTITREDITHFFEQYMYQKPRVTVLITSAENAHWHGLTNEWLEQTVAP